MTEFGDEARFSARLRQAIDVSGLTLDGLQRRLAGQGLAVGRSTLSYWQNGRRLPTGQGSIAVVAALEQILKTPAGALVDALAAQPPSHRLGDTGPADLTRVDQIIGRTAGMAQQARDSEVVGTLAAGFYGPFGELQTLRMTVAIRALTDVQRVPFTHGCLPGEDPRLVRHEMISGGRIGRVRFDQQDRAVLGEIIFDRSVRRGECHLYQYEVHDGNGAPRERYLTALETTKAFVAIELTFHPELLPVRIEEFERLVCAGPDIMNRNRLLDSRGKVAMVRERARRGIVGLQWEYA